MDRERSLELSLRKEKKSVFLEDLSKGHPPRFPEAGNKKTKLAEYQGMLQVLQSDLLTSIFALSPLNHPPNPFATLLFTVTFA